MMKTKDLFFQRFAKSFNRASLVIDTVGVTIKGSNPSQSIQFDLLAGVETYNCLGTLMPANRFFSEIYSFKNNSIYCKSQYQSHPNQQTHQIDSQPLISDLDQWELSPHVLQASADPGGSGLKCLQGLDVQLFFETQVFQRRFIAPECIQWK